MSGPTSGDGRDGTPDGGAEGPHGSALVQQAAWTLVWLSVASAGVLYWGSWTAGPWAAALAPALVVVGLAGTALVWTLRRPLSTAMAAVGLAASLASAAITQGTAIHLRHYVTTDSAAFNQVAARLLLQGRNPYTASLAASAHLLKPPAAFWTYRVDGRHALEVSYPAGSFLLQVPLRALGVAHMPTDWLDLAAWLATGVLIFCMVPAALRWVAPLLVLTGIYLVPLSDGGTDALFLPFLVLALWRWDRYPGRATPWLPSWVGPVALGVACSIKQTPWFCVPFLVLGVALVARRDGTGRPVAVATRYALWTLGAFVVVDLPFIVWAPGAWLHGVLLPVVDPLVPDGQGVVALALHGLTGGVVPVWLSAAGALAVVGLLVALAAWPARLWRSWLFLLPLALVLPARSFTNYLLDFLPAALVAALTVRPWTTGPAATAPSGGRRRVAAGVLGALALASAACVAVGLTSAPLAVTVGRVAASGDPTSEYPMRWRQVTVSVTNHAAAALRPRFMVSSGSGHPSGFWEATAVRGAVPVPPGGTTTFLLRPPEPTWTPTHGQAWVVQAYTTSPAALSSSPLQRWRLGKVLH